MIRKPFSSKWKKKWDEYFCAKERRENAFFYISYIDSTVLKINSLLNNTGITRSILLVLICLSLPVSSHKPFVHPRPSGKGGRQSKQMTEESRTFLQITRIFFLYLSFNFLL